MDKIFLFTPSDEELEALVSMSPEEVNAQLIELGIDPYAPLPERIQNLIDAQEDQNDGSSAGGTLLYINTEVKNLRLKNNSLKKQRRRAVFQSLRHWAAAVIIAAFLLIIGLSNAHRKQPQPAETLAVIENTEKRGAALPENKDKGGEGSLTLNHAKIPMKPNGR